jgi:hypothetical protein
MNHNLESRMNPQNMGQESLRIKIDIGLMYRIENNFYLGYGFLGHKTL